MDSRAPQLKEYGSELIEVKRTINSQRREFTEENYPNPPPPLTGLKSPSRIQDFCSSSVNLEVPHFTFPI